MQQDEFFPLDAIPPRVRRAILHEFQGRRPTVQEVAQISDRHWLATPEIGPSTLEKIHEALQPQPHQGDGASPKMTDAELLDRLEFRPGGASEHSTHPENTDRQDLGKAPPEPRADAFLPR